MAALCYVAAFAQGATAVGDSVENVRAEQRPGTKLVDIYYDLVTEGSGDFDVSVSVTSGVNTPPLDTLSGDVGGEVAPGRNKHIVWDAGKDWPGNVDSNLVCTVTATMADDGKGGVQLWAGGPYWATCNVGASKPEDYGLYFWWGDTVGHRPSGDTFPGSPFEKDKCLTYGMSFQWLRSEGWIDASGNLAPAHDAARAHLGAPWRMPTDAEFAALINNCTTAWTTRNGVYGRLVTGTGAYASRSIFLPAAGLGYGSYLDYAGSDGYYWSSTSLSSIISWPTMFLHFSSASFGRSGNIARRSDYIRWYGRSVRPLRVFAE